MSDSNQNSITKRNILRSDLSDNIEFQAQLFNMLIMDDFGVDKWITRFKEYERKNKRFFYSYITQYIFDEEKDEKIGKLLGNIQTMIDQIETSDTYDNNNGLLQKATLVSYDQYLMICKLYDHCNLASKQRLAYKNKATQEDIESKIEETRKIIKIENEKFIETRIKEYEKNITSQLIGLVAMFTALSFLLVGGISSFGNIFQMLSTASLSKILILSDVWLLCMFNLFTLFIKMIALITNKKFEITRYVITINITLCAILAVLIVLPTTISISRSYLA